MLLSFSALGEVGGEEELSQGPFLAVLLVSFPRSARIVKASQHPNSPSRPCHRCDNVGGVGSRPARLAGLSGWLPAIPYTLILQEILENYNNILQ
jgi:hypothetical protein